MMKSILVLTICLLANSFSYSQNMLSPGLNHIAIFVKDLKKSDAFYQQILRLKTIPEPFKDGKHTWYEIGDNAALHVIEGSKVGNLNDRNSHLCFRVNSVKEFISVLNKAGIPFSNAAGKPQSVTIRPDGIQQIYFQDPDGFWIEINDDK